MYVVHTYVCMCVCVCMCVYMCVYIHTHTYLPVLLIVAKNEKLVNEIKIKNC